MVLVDFRVEDFGYFVLRFAINFNWWWGCLDLVWIGVESCRLEHRNIEDRVDCMHAIQKPKSVRPGASLGDHFEGAKYFSASFFKGQVVQKNCTLKNT